MVLYSGFLFPNCEIAVREAAHANARLHNIVHSKSHHTTDCDKNQNSPSELLKVFQRGSRKVG
jgi:hypothetical protein